MSDLPFFLGRLVRRPHEVAAVAPSSQALARAMAMEVPDDAIPGPVVELGPGTGRITRALLERGVAPPDLHCFEMSADFADHIRHNFDGVNVHHAPAQSLGQSGLRDVGAVISGLPLLSIPNPVVEDILNASFSVLRPGGVFVQFTYGPTPPVPEELREKLRLSHIRGRRIWNNLPPARIYTFRGTAELA
ncbi:methyltransferase domain-containing protein [Primorskyibacter aestuariivivens]|uniref:class I SAM-dependent methyltransferase n=1 Tax=Primorskyibacter aestuariivivens TaxID=1888912 RepID=UPI002300B789|nr:methyltransferase domain-containing protein [Primorskyibacter aestuariivivens]MDA7430128.1 methyltransferase domain-containing protein [Primorskyibacter aestuariivivens]